MKGIKVEFLRHGMVLVVFGAILIAAGGVITTKGWNTRALYSQRKNLIRAVAQEWLRNQISLRRPPFTTLVDNEEPEILRTYPALKASALSNALASGLFSFKTSAEDVGLGLTMANYESAIISANKFFAILNNDLVRNHSLAKEFHRQTHGSEWFKNLTTQHEEMRVLVAKRYRWAFAEHISPTKAKSSGRQMDTD